jgi:hypothetical protein
MVLVTDVGGTHSFVVFLRRKQISLKNILSYFIPPSPQASSNGPPKDRPIYQSAVREITSPRHVRFGRSTAQLTGGFLIGVADIPADPHHFDSLLVPRILIYRFIVFPLERGTFTFKASSSIPMRMFWMRSMAPNEATW